MTQEDTGEQPDGMRSWRSSDGGTIFIDKGNGERVIVRDTDGDGFADGVYETGSGSSANDDD